MLSVSVAFNFVLLVGPTVRRSRRKFKYFTNRAKNSYVIDKMTQKRNDSCQGLTGLTTGTLCSSPPWEDQIRGYCLKYGFHIPYRCSTAMSLQSMGKSSNLRSKTVERPDINRRETSLEGPSLVLLSVVEEVAMSAPIAELKKAARTALLVYKTAQVWTRKTNGTYCMSRSEFTVCRRSRKPVTKWHTNDDLATIQTGSSLPFGARLRMRRIHRNGYLRKCKIFLKTYRGMINHHDPIFYTDHRLQHSRRYFFVH